MTKHLLSVAMILAASLLSACDPKPESYPVTGETCGPEDPVQTIEATDCFVPPA